MVNTNKLKAMIVEKGITQTSLSGKLGLSIQGLNKKLNGRSPITLDEAYTLIDLLEIQDPVEIFFARIS